jgi:PAS domain S-box-containing protein
MALIDLRRLRGRLARRPWRRRSGGLRRALHRLKDSEAQRLAHVGCWEWDAALDRVRWSEELYRVYGLKPEAFDGTYEGFLSRVYEPDRQATRDVVARALRDGRPFEYSHRIVREDGSVRMLQTRGGAVRNEDGTVARLVGCCMDVTEHWQTRTRLDESLSLLRATLDATFDGIFVMDLTGRLLVCNRRAIELWGLPEAMTARGDLEEILRFGAAQLAEPDAFIASERRLLQNPAFEGMDMIRFKDGRVFERYTRPQLLDGRVAGRVCSYRDVTRRERALAQLYALNETLDGSVKDRTADLERRSDELRRSNAELEFFAAAASHDLSAPARKINSFVGLLAARVGPKLDAEEAQLVDRLRRISADMLRLIADVLMLARVKSQELPLEEVPLTPLLSEVTADLEEPPAPEAIRAGPLPVVLGHATLWHRLLHNLLSNALKFRAPDRPPRVRLSSRALPDGGAEIRVEDNGIGFEPRYARDIFLPFRRLHTASEYAGHGIGLAACERIVQRYGGTITAEGTPGQGAVFTVTLPPAAVVRQA